MPGLYSTTVFCISSLFKIPISINRKLARLADKIDGSTETIFTVEKVNRVIDEDEEIVEVEKASEKIEPNHQPPLKETEKMVIQEAKGINDAEQEAERKGEEAKQEPEREPEQELEDSSPDDYLSDEDSITMSTNPIIKSDLPTVLPPQMAQIVTVFSKGSTLSLRLGTYFVETILESVRVSTLTTLGVTRRVVETILSKADEDTPGANRWVTSGMNAVNEAAVMTNFVVSVSFHLARSTVATFSYLALDTVHILNAIFGSTETSRAIASISSLIQKELGHGAGIYALFSSLAFFSILQARGWRRTLENIEMHVLWDVVVLDSGETRSQQLHPLQNLHDVEEGTIVSHIPQGAEYKVMVDEISTKTITVDFTGGDSSSIRQFSIPEGATVLSEETSSRAVSNNSTLFNYKITFESRSHNFRERKGIMPSPTESIIGGDSLEIEYGANEMAIDQITTAEVTSIHNGRSVTPSTSTQFSTIHKSVRRSSSVCTLRSINEKVDIEVVADDNSSFIEKSSIHSILDTEPIIDNTDNTSFHQPNYNNTSFGYNQFPPGHITYNMAKYVRYASASYGQSFMKLLGIGLASVTFPKDDNHHVEHYAFSHHARVSLDDILLSSYTDTAINDNSGIPLLHFVALDHEAKAVVLTIRGTLGLEDILTDLTCEYENFEWQGQLYKAHSGMLKCAQLHTRSTSRILRTVAAALNRCGPDYGLILCGHSLGGGVAALLGILLSEQSRESGQFVTSHKTPLPAGRPIRCFCYGPPASISPALRKATKELIISVVYGLDIVPCLSLGLFRDFQELATIFTSDKKNALHKIWHRLLAQLSSPSPSGIHQSEDDYLYSVLSSLRQAMKNEKLVPPGEVYHIGTSTVFESHDGRTKKATRIVGTMIVDVEKRFSEPVFGREVFHHSPVHYERALNILEQGVSEAPLS